MTERFTHWDDDLVESVGAAIGKYITVGVLNPQFVYAVIGRRGGLAERHMVSP